jgi:cardiolipin synthase (CMP-forming)
VATPAWVTLPNVVSVIRLLLIPLFVALTANDEVGWAGIVLGVIGSTDWIDGYLARRLDQVSDVGKFLDPLADRIAVAVAVIAGLIWNVIPGWLGWGVVVREVLVLGGVFYAWTLGVLQIPVRMMGKWATFLLYIAITGLYIAKGFDIHWVWSLAQLVGAIGLFLYYAVAVAYFGDLREIARSHHAESAGE